MPQTRDHTSVLQWVNGYLKKLPSSDMYNMNESQGHYGKWKKSE